MCSSEADPKVAQCMEVKPTMQRSSLCKVGFPTPRSCVAGSSKVVKKKTLSGLKNGVEEREDRSRTKTSDKEKVSRKVSRQ